MRLGQLGVVCGFRGLLAARREGESTLLPVAGAYAGGFGLIAWIIAGIDLIFILFS